MITCHKDGHHFSDDAFKCILLNENVWILFKISLKFVPYCPINDIPALVQIMAPCRLGDKPLSESVMVRFPTYICVTRPQWVKAPIITSPGNGSSPLRCQAILWPSTDLLSVNCTLRHKFHWNPNLIFFSRTCMLKCGLQNVSHFVQVSCVTLYCVNSLRPSDAIWRHRYGSTLDQVDGLLPDGTKPLPEPMLTYHQ